MATNLLLEGDDLEALLLRAAAEGGANARILRAEKVRQGGFMGFFAREHFEVAVEIPDAEQQPDPQQGRPARAYDEADEEQVAALVAALSQDRTPDPAKLAAGGLLGLADRVSAAERAAAGGPAGRSAGQGPESVDVRSGAPNALAGVRTRSAFERHLPPSAPAPSEPAATSRPGSGWWAGVPTPAHGIAALSAANGIDGVVPWTEPVAAAAARAVDERISADRADAAQADAERAFAEEQAAAEAVIRAAVESRRGAVRREPAAAHADRPATSTPEFTDLFDTLRSDARPAAAPTAAPAAPTAAAPAARTVTAGMPLQRSAGTGASRVQVTIDPVSTATAAPVPVEPPAPEPTAAQDAGMSQHPTVAIPDPPTETAIETAIDSPTAVAQVAPPSQRTPVPPLVPAAPPNAQTARGLLVVLGAEDGEEPCEPGSTDLDGSSDLQLNADRHALRRLGVPASWTRRYKGPDRFSGVLRMLDRLPNLDIAADTRLVAVVGPASLVTLEAHRTALDLAIEDQPRPIVVVPPQPGQARRAAIARAQKLAAGVVAIATEDDVEGLLDTLQAVGAGAVVAVVEADRGPAATQAWLERLDTVDALVVEGAAGVPDPAAVLQLDLPVVRLDGIPVDRVTWSALLCARMLTSLGLDPVTDRSPVRPTSR